MFACCHECSGKGYLAHKSESGAKYFDKCWSCRGSGRAPKSIGAQTDLAARRLITAAEVRRKAGAQ